MRSVETFLEETFSAATAPPEYRFHQKAARRVLKAMVAFRLNAPKLAHDMCKPQPDPTQRGWFIEECSAWHGNRETLAIQLARVKEPSLRTGIALAVGSVPVKHISTSEKTAWSPLLANWHTNESDSLTHSTADWVMRRWKLQSLWGARHSHELLSGSQTSVQESKAPPTEESGEKQWSTNSIGMTLITIPEGKFARDVERRFSSDGRNFKHRNGEIVKRFLLADREVSRQQFLEFIRDPDADKPSWASDLRDRSKLQHAINAVNWYDAIMFCNWLSKRENLVAYYEKTGEKEARGNDEWKTVPEANGYRLPTEEKWEYACRAGTATDFSFGTDDSLLQRYGVVLKSKMEIPGSKLPNVWGIFDVHGNAYEWCQDWYGPTRTNRVLRGGSFAYNAEYARSASRNLNFPDYRNLSYGFRVARNFSRTKKEDD